MPDDRESLLFRFHGTPAEVLAAAQRLLGATNRHPWRGRAPGTCLVTGLDRRFLPAGPRCLVAVLYSPGGHLFGGIDPYRREDFGAFDFGEPVEG